MLSDQKEFGWRTRTTETGYGVKTLLGNWHEERRDVKELKRGKPIPSDFDHYFETTQKQSYSKNIYISSKMYVSGCM